MRTARAIASTAGLALALLLAPATTRAAPAPEMEARALTRHAAKAQGLLHVVEQVVGPLPAIASTPFFGLAALSGVALVSRSAWAQQSDALIVRMVRDNALVGEVSDYASLPLVLVLAALAVLSYLANSGKIQGALGKILRLAEDGSVGASYVLLALLTLTRAAPGEAPSVVRMGVADVSAGVLLAIAVGLGLGAMMITRFALDVLIWLSPVPFIDLVFESAKKLFTVGLLALYLVSPAVAAIASIVMLLASLEVCGWALRMLGFAFGVAIGPALGQLLGAAPPPLVRPELEARGPGGESGKPRLALRAYALGVPGLRRRQPLALFALGSEPWLVPETRLGATRPLPLAAPGERIVLLRTWLWLELRVLAADDSVRRRVAISRAYLERAAEIAHVLGARDAGGAGAELRREGELAPRPS